MSRVVWLFSVVVFLAGCTSVPLSEEPLKDLGSFRLGYNVVYAEKAQKGPVSRDAAPEEWVTVMRQALAKRFVRYQGDQLYHFGISVEGYMLAPPGVPLLYTPKSALIINVTVWDDAANAKLNAEVEQFTIFEDTTGESYFAGSGNIRTREQQMAGLAENAVRRIETWMAQRRDEDGWFESRPGAATEASVPRDELIDALD